MGGLVDALLRRVARAGFRRGIAGEHWAWLLIAGTAYLLRRARRPEERTERIRLRAGDRYLVSLQPKRAKSGRRPPSAGDAQSATSEVLGVTGDPHLSRPSPG